MAHVNVKGFVMYSFLPKSILLLVFVQTVGFIDTVQTIVSPGTYSVVILHCLKALKVEVQHTM